MSKRKKIFHKPQEEVPSAEDILNYLNEDSSAVPSPKKKSSPGGAKERSKKMKMDESSMDDLLSKNEDEKEEVMKSSPAPSMESFSKSISLGGEGGNQKNKKKHEFEKVMLSEPLVSDAVEGYALLGDRKKAKTIIDEINHNIASQTTKKNNRAVVMRIAAILLIVFLISGGSLYLFDQMAEDKMTAVSNEKASPVSDILSDTSVIANKNEIKPDNTKTNELALEREEADKPISVPNVSDNKPGNSDGYITVKKEVMGPTDEKSMNGNGTGFNSGTLPMVTESEKKDDNKEFSKTNAPVERSIAADTAMLFKDMDLAYQDDLEESKAENKVSRQRSTSERSREPSKKMKSKAKGNADTYAPAAKSQSESLDQEISTGATRKGYLLEEGIRLYNQGKYAEAKEIFMGVLTTQPSNQEAIFFNGLSGYKLKQYEAALSNLSKVIPASRRYDEARWNMALIYLETGKKEEARKLLKELSKTGNSYSEKAFEELKKLE
jgi:TolA-binding protein